MTRIQSLLFTAIMLAATSFPSTAFSFPSAMRLAGRSSFRKIQDTSSSSISVHNIHADFDEMVPYEMVPYEMVPLPDSMLDTTLFIGNLNEFANDQDLSDVFCQVTALSSVPSVVVRKANMASLHYGFVSFPSIQEKEAAILRFHNSQFMGQVIKVEEIRDHPNKGRVKVPERMVAYVIGAVKKTSSREVNTMRRVTKPTVSYKKKRKKKKSKIPRTKKKIVRYKLTDKEQEGFQRAIRSGFITLNGTGYRRGRKTSNLACAHRQWCDTSASKPQIILCKASGGRPLDCVIIDLSPLRASSGEDLELWKEQISIAAQSAGVELRLDYLEDNCQVEEYTPSKIQEMHISKLPVISMGVFEGERSKAKAMIRELTKLWDLPSDQEAPAQSLQQSSRKKQRGDIKKNDKRKNNKRRNQRDQEMDFFF